VSRFLISLNIVSSNGYSDFYLRHTSSIVLATVSYRPKFLQSYREAVSTTGSIIASATTGSSTVVRLCTYVPVGGAPAIGRLRPYKIGASADVEAAWSLYHGRAPCLWPPGRKSGGVVWRPPGG